MCRRFGRFTTARGIRTYLANQRNARRRNACSLLPAWKRMMQPIEIAWPPVKTRCAFSKTSSKTARVGAWPIPHLRGWRLLRSTGHPLNRLRAGRHFRGLSGIFSSWANGRVLSVRTTIPISWRWFCSEFTGRQCSRLLRESGLAMRKSNTSSVSLLKVSGSPHYGEASCRVAHKCSCISECRICPSPPPKQTVRSPPRSGRRRQAAWHAGKRFPTDALGTESGMSAIGTKYR